MYFASDFDTLYSGYIFSVLVLMNDLFLQLYEGIRGYVWLEKVLLSVFMSFVRLIKSLSMVHFSIFYLLFAL